MTGGTININGIPIQYPNDVINTNVDFYISYNDRDISTYGCDTTALVSDSTGYPTKFLILNGNHVKQYNDIIENGGNYGDCMKYFIDHENMQSTYSENWDEITEYKDGKLTIIKDDRYCRHGE